MDDGQSKMNAPSAGSLAAGDRNIVSMANCSAAPSNPAASSPPPPQQISRRGVSSPPLPCNDAIPHPDAIVISNCSALAAPPLPPAPAATRIIVARPPLNVYQTIAIIRDDNDAVVCEDPEHPGKKKRIIMTQLSLDACSNKDFGNNTIKAGDGAPVVKKEEKSNKKEIPVPTITTVKRYDRDVPPNYAIPQSYIRNVCPTYEEVDETVEYNIDAEDEFWWMENTQFGPFAQAKIIMGDEKEPSSESLINHPIDNSIDIKIPDAVKSEENFLKQMNEKNGRKKMRKILKSSKSSESGDNSMVLDQTNSDNNISAPPPPPPTTSHHPNMTIEQVLLLNPKYLYSQHSMRALLQKYNPKLPLRIFEQMMDALEKATGFESIMTISQAEEILVTKISRLVDIFGPLSAKERRLEEEMEEQYVSRWLKNTTTTTTTDAESQQQQPLPILAQPVTLPAVIHQVYNYWVAKRSKLKKPLLRRYCPPTAASDQNPHQVFRQRDKEKRRLRKKRQNYIEAYKKMKQLKMDFERVGVLCELILQREKVNSMLVELTNEYFEERLHGWTNTSGAPRQSRTLNRGMIESVLNVPQYFDDGLITRVRGGKKRQRPQVGWNADVRDPSPIPPTLGVVPGVNLPPLPNPASMTNLPQGTKPSPLPVMVAAPPSNIVVAGHDDGLPAPSFLQPLASRESYPITNWDDAVPSIPSYVNGNLTTQPDKFRHRPRLGRGGRINIDRVPCPAEYANEGTPPAPTVITYGPPMKRFGYDIGTLGADGPASGVGPERVTGTNAESAPKVPPAQCLADLLPKSLGDTVALSRRIEEICALGLMEDNQNPQGSNSTTVGSSTLVTSASNNGNTASSTSAVAAVTWAEEMDEVLVPIVDWMEAPEALNLWGSEKFVIGPL